MYSRPDGVLDDRAAAFHPDSGRGGRGRMMQRMEQVGLIGLKTFINDGHRRPFH